MEGVAADVEGFHFGVGDFDALRIGPVIECTLDLESGLGCLRRSTRPLAADAWLGAPVLGDVAEQPVFDLVPFRCAGRIVADLDRHGDRIGQLCNSTFHSRERAPLAAVRRDHQLRGSSRYRTFQRVFKSVG